jgi:hypothetical protein
MARAIASPVFEIAPAVRNAETLNARDYLARIARIRALARTAAPRSDGVDVIASPTLCVTSPLMSDVADADSHLRVNRRIVRNTVAVGIVACRAGGCNLTLKEQRSLARCPWDLPAPSCRCSKRREVARAAPTAAIPFPGISLWWTAVIPCKAWLLRTDYRRIRPLG